VVDSDLDWSQDYIEVAEKLRAMHVTEVNFGLWPWLNSYLEVWPGLPRTKVLRPAVPAPGWAVVGPSNDKLNQYGLLYRYPNIQPWWEHLTPAGKAGSMVFYYVPPGAIRMRE
jgi:hypothetical protein